MTLWSARSAAEATGGRSTVDWQVTGVSIDTRTLVPGDLFVALRAARDGHDFVAQALEKGAAAALVSRVPDDVAGDAPLLIVPDVQAALEALGRAARARTKARVVAITGSVGKTSTKEMLRAMLAAQGATHASAASYNNHWGVPLTLARMPAETAYAVIEIGMNAPGEIAPLARQARPHVAMVTTVAAAHLEAFESLDGIAHEKASILEGLEPGGTAVLNADIAQAPILADWSARCAAETRWFGETDPDWRLERVHVAQEVAQDVTLAEAATPLGPLLYKINSPGRHFAMNALGALACCDALGADLARAATALGHWTPYAGRGVREKITVDAARRDVTLTLIDDSYNANPASMAAALDVLGASDAARRIAVLGDMKELGRTEAALHAGLADHPAMARVDLVHCVGPLMRGLHAALPPEKRGLWTETAREMAVLLPRQLAAGDCVLVKASLSTGLAVAVDAVRKIGDAQDR